MTSSGGGRGRSRIHQQSHYVNSSGHYAPVTASGGGGGGGRYSSRDKGKGKAKDAFDDDDELDEYEGNDIASSPAQHLDIGTLRSSNNNRRTSSSASASRGRFGDVGSHSYSAAGGPGGSSTSASGAHMHDQHDNNTDNNNNQTTFIAGQESMDDYDEDGLPEEELNDARRFEDFETIDWIQDTLFERSRRIRESRAAAQRLSASRFSSSPRTQQLRAWFSTILHATQSWLVVTLVGAGIGVNAALIDVITSWLTDLKFGYCRVNWWLNSKFCCWEIDPVGSGDDATGKSAEELCEDWRNWSEVFFGLGYLVYVGYAIAFAFSAAYLVRSFSPYAAGSGISEIKCILAGFIMKGYLSLTTLLIKSITLPLAIASGLSVGKEGPSVHVASAIGNVIGGSFKRFSQSQAKMREIVTAASAAGVAVAFGSPIGGVLFALEEMTVNFPIKTMWRSFFCALVATVTLSAMNPFRTGKLVLFQVSYDRDWHFFEIGGFILIGIFGGLYGAFVIKYNMQVQSFRRKHLAKHGVAEAMILAGLTAIIGYHNRFLRIDMTESLDILFRECEAKGGDYDNLCQTWAQWRMVNSLLLATVLRIVLIVLSYGAKVPAGIFVPSMAVGATFGRMVGILVKATYRAYPHWAIFAACEPEKPCITPGTYAFLGAAAALGGIMRITVTVVVIMFELTGALTYILPTMIVLMVTKAVSDQFGKGGIADQMIRFNGFPFLDKEDHQFNEPVSHVMKRNVLAVPAVGMRLQELETRFASSQFRGFPVVQGRRDSTLLGYITRSDLRRGIDRARRSGRVMHDNARCLFTRRDQAANPVLSSDDDEDDEEDYEHLPENTIDLSQWVIETVLTVSSKQPLEIVMQLFKKMGPRVILVEQQGQLRGLITIKDILKEIIAHEQFEDAASNLLDAELEETLEEASEWVKEKTAFIAEKLGLPTRHQNIKLESGGMDALPLSARSTVDDATHSSMVFDAAEESAPRSERPRLDNPFEMSTR